ncbi:unnamed protein product [Closterium sp. Yama58-4]|nr:unnamed protein product [Closterium sp. Yama58-4]
MLPFWLPKASSASGAPASTGAGAMEGGVPGEGAEAAISSGAGGVQGGDPGCAVGGVAEGSGGRLSMVSWLEKEEVRVAATENGELIAVALGTTLVIADGHGAHDGRPVEPVSVRPACDSDDAITALEWITFSAFNHRTTAALASPNRPPGAFMCLAVGTALGFVLVYCETGVLLAKQMVHTEAVVRLRVRGVEAGMVRNDGTQELCAITRNATCVINSVQLQSVLKQRVVQLEDTVAANVSRGFASALSFMGAGRKGGRDDEGGSGSTLAFKKWRTGRATTKWSDGAVAGTFPSPLFQVQVPVATSYLPTAPAFPSPSLIHS